MLNKWSIVLLISYTSGILVRMPVRISVLNSVQSTQTCPKCFPYKSLDFQWRVSLPNRFKRKVKVVNTLMRDEKNDVRRKTCFSLLARFLCPPRMAVAMPLKVADQCV